MDNNTSAVANNNTCECKKEKKCFLRKLFLFMLAIIAILKLVEKIKEKSFERFNSKGRVRKHIALISKKKISSTDKLDGVCIYSLFSCVNVDLSEAKLSEDSFVSVVSFFSNVKIKLPDDVNVNTDGLSFKSTVKSSISEDGDEGGMYVAYNANFSRIRIDN